MDRPYFICDGLHPAQALKLLAEASSGMPGDYLGEIGLRAPSGEFDDAAIVAPDVDPRSGKDGHKKALDGLIRAYRRMDGKIPKRTADISAAMPISKGLFRLLADCGGESGDDSAEVAENEFLVLGRNLDKTRARDVFEELRFHATSLKIASKASKNGTVWLFHVLDDHERKSTFQSAVAGSMFAGCRVLNGFRGDGRRIFLHPEITPGKTALDSFCRIVTSAPALFKIGKAADPGGLLAAIDMWPGEKRGRAKNRFVFLNLAGIFFSSRAEFTPKPAEHADFEFYDLSKNRDALGELRSALESIGPQIGYRLELRTTRHLEAAEKQRDKFQEELVNIEYKLAYLESMARPRPLLLRFTQAGLPALADVLASYPQPVIRDGLMQYAFQSVENRPSGLHYLMIDPKAVKSELEPLSLLSARNGDAVRFHLDPFWARYYHGADNQYLVFTPEGSALSPPMHDWDNRSMDAYLREIMGKWLDSENETATVPEKPIYIFDGKTGPDEKIHISVLDRDQFQPLKKRLGWLNDNLEIIRAVEKEESFSGMAEDIAEKRFADHFRAEREEAVAAFEEAAEDAGEKIAARLGEMTEVFTVEIDRFVEKIRKTAAGIPELRKRLETYTDASAGMRKKLSQAENQKENIENKSKYLSSEMKRLENKVVRPALREAMKTREKIEEEVMAEIDKLRQTHDRIRKKLYEL